MNGAGRAIQAAVWSAGGHDGPGGRAMPELYERPVKECLPRAPEQEYDGTWDRPRRWGRGSVVTGLRLQGVSRGPATRPPIQKIGGSGPIIELADSAASSRPGAQPPPAASARGRR